jgi:hypothetical protein
MRSLAIWALCVLVGAPALWAQDDTKDKPKPDTPSKTSEEVKKITGEYQKSVNEFYQKNQEKLNDKKTTDEEREKIYGDVPKPEKAVAALLEIADKAPKDDPGAFEALQFALNYSGRDAEGQKTQDKVLDLLIKDYAANEKIGSLVTMLAYSTSLKAEQLLQAVIEKNSKKDNRGKATFTLGQFKKNLLQYSDQLKDPEKAKELEKFLSKDMLSAAKQVDKAKLEKELEKLFETVDAKYGDVELYKNPRTKKATLLGDRAKGELYELKNLAVGMTAPEIEGEDLDAKALKLSDYRGKVVMLDFWGNW